MSIVVAMRCLSGPKVGMGHLMRCREIARYLQTQGHRAVIMGPPKKLQIASDRDLFLEWLPEAEAFDAQADCEIFLDLCNRHQARHANMDDYRITPDYQKALRGAGIRTLQQFDASRPWAFWTPLLVNAGPSERHEDYTDWLSDPATRTLFGPQYAVLRPEFTQITPRPDGRALERLFICFGGGADNGVLRRVVLTLRAALPETVTLVVVCAGTNPAALEYQNLLADVPAVEFHIAPADMATLMQGCDAAILAGGTMSYEAAICGLPLVLIAIAANQERACCGWQDLIGAVYLGQAVALSDAALLEAITGLVQNTDRRRLMAAKARAAVDGRGVVRLVDALLET